MAPRKRQPMRVVPLPNQPAKSKSVQSAASGPAIARANAVRDPNALKPSPYNSRKHTKAQVKQIAASIREFGFTRPILIDDTDTILAGHGANQAAMTELRLAEVPVVVVSGLSEAQKRAYIIADNKIAANSAWDDDILKAELAFLEKADFNVALTGFSDSELAKLLASEVETEADDAKTPEGGAQTVCVTGDVWLLGRHRLVCGDATKADDVAKALAGATPHLMVTDPPYGVEYDPEWRDEKQPRAKGKRAAGPVANDDIADWREAWALFPGDVAYVWHAALLASTVEASLKANGFEIRSQIIWDKGRLVLGRGDFHWRHEAAWYAVRTGRASHHQGDRTQTTVWAVPMPAKSETGHGTQKPLDLMRRCVIANSERGQGVYEPFSGSGTTILACERADRLCYALEIDPAHIDRTILRWQQDTGLPATLESTGQSFLEVLAQRTPQAAIGLAGHKESA